MSSLQTEMPWEMSAQMTGGTWIETRISPIHSTLGLNSDQVASLERHHLMGWTTTYLAQPHGHDTSDFICDDWISPNEMTPLTLHRKMVSSCQINLGSREEWKKMLGNTSLTSSPIRSFFWVACCQSLEIFSSLFHGGLGRIQKNSGNWKTPKTWSKNPNS